MKPLFAEHASKTLHEAAALFEQRGDQYGDTWRHCQFLIMKAVAKELSIEIPDAAFRALATAAFVDMKYQRFEGGWNPDHARDGINYQAFLAAEMEVAKARVLLEKKEDI